MSLIEEFNGGKMLDGMYSMKEDLMHKYLDKGMIPPWSEDLIDEPNYQSFLKKLTGWLVDELAELSKENYHLNELLNQHDREDNSAINIHLLAGLGELADAMHFFIELMIFVGITSEDINEYYRLLCKERNIDLSHTSDGLSSTINYGRFTNTWDEEKARVSLRYSTSLGIPGVDTRVPLGLEVNNLRELTMWNITKALSHANRQLKNKEWSVKIQETDTLQYKRDLMVAWLYMGQLMDLQGMLPKTIYYFYYLTTNKNLKRLENGYYSLGVCHPTGRLGRNQ